MSTVTLEQIQKRQAELARLIAALSEQASPARLITIEADEIELQPGEHYAGAVLDADGGHQHHLVLMAPRPEAKLAWQAAMDWAEEVGGALPTRQEQALLYANCKPHLQPTWHWSCQEHEDDASYAWFCIFYYGTQYYGPKSFEGSAVAVRRV